MTTHNRPFRFLLALTAILALTAAVPAQQKKAPKGKKKAQSALVYDAAAQQQALEIFSRDHRAEVEEYVKEIDAVSKKGPFQPNWPSMEQGYKVPDWYLDGKFGIFIHWGVYSVPGYGSEWYPRNMYLPNSDVYKHHVETYGPQAKFGYKDFIPQFKAEKFNADEWAALFEKSGAKFIVPVAEHHDGFQMYESKLSDWNAARMGPKRDIIGELSKSVRAHGMVFGLSSHRAEHWWFMNGGMTFDSDVKDPKYAAFYGPAQKQDDKDPNAPNQVYLENWLARTCELVDKYQPQLVWFDWWINQPAFEPYLQKFGAYYYNRAAQWGKGVAVNYKFNAFPAKAAVLDIERGQLGEIRKDFWQTDTAVGKNSWGYVKNMNYKTADSVIDDLVDIVSKNGALLLNIGPAPDGSIPEGDQKILLEIGQWLKVCGDAVYGTRPWRVYGEGPTQVVAGSFADTKRKPFTGQDFRFTVKGDAIYAVALDWPGQQAVIKALAKGSPFIEGDVAEVRLLGAEGKLEFTRDADGLKVALPANKPCENAFALVIKGLMTIPSDGSIEADAHGVIKLDAPVATLHGKTLKLEVKRDVQTVGLWQVPTEWVAWDKVKFSKPGKYDVSAKVACQAGGSQATVAIGAQTLALNAPRTGSWEKFETVPLGQVVIQTPGVVEVSVKPVAQGWKDLNLSTVTLTPVK